MCFCKAGKHNSTKLSSANDDTLNSLVEDSLKLLMEMHFDQLDMNINEFTKPTGKDGDGVPKSNDSSFINSLITRYLMMKANEIPFSNVSKVCTLQYEPETIKVRSYECLMKKMEHFNKMLSLDRSGNSISSIDKFESGSNPEMPNEKSCQMESKIQSERSGDLLQLPSTNRWQISNKKDWKSVSEKSISTRVPSKHDKTTSQSMTTMGFDNSVLLISKESMGTLLNMDATLKKLKSSTIDSIKRDLASLFNISKNSSCQNKGDVGICNCACCRMKC